MAASASFLIIRCFCLVVALLASGASAQLSSTFYDTSCPRALATIKSAVNAAVAKEARMGASLLRLHFHDCFVQASVHRTPCSVFLCFSFFKTVYVDPICQSS